MLQRRAVLRVLASGAVCFSAAAAQTKLSPAAARYRPVAEDAFTCAACQLFQPPRSCLIVAGDISPEGWCKFFSLPD